MKSLDDEEFAEFNIIPIPGSLVKFWEWMDKNKYGAPVLRCNCHVFTPGFYTEDGEGCVPTVQMCIGYMIEYCRDEDIDWISSIKDEPHVTHTNLYNILYRLVCV